MEPPFAARAVMMVPVLSLTTSPEPVSESCTQRLGIAHGLHDGRVEPVEKELRVEGEPGCILVLVRVLVEPRAARLRGAKQPVCRDKKPTEVRVFMGDGAPWAKPLSQVGPQVCTQPEVAGPIEDSADDALCCAQATPGGN